jgi:hypothetical protein
LHTLERFAETKDSTIPGAWDVWATSLIEILSVEKVRAAMTQPGVQRILLPVPAERWVIFCSTVVAEPGHRFVLDVLDISEPDGWLADWVVTELIPMNVDNRAEIVLQQTFRSRGSPFFTACNRQGWGSISRTLRFASLSHIRLPDLSNSGIERRGEIFR